MLFRSTKRDGYTIVPLKMYVKNGYAKVLIGLGKGKKDYDKRSDMKKKEAKREIERNMHAMGNNSPSLILITVNLGAFASCGLY